MKTLLLALIVIAAGGPASVAGATIATTDGSNDRPHQESVSPRLATGPGLKKNIAPKGNIAGAPNAERSTQAFPGLKSPPSINHAAAPAVLPTLPKSDRHLGANAPVVGGSTTKTGTTTAAINGSDLHRKRGL